MIYISREVPFIGLMLPLDQCVCFLISHLRLQVIKPRLLHSPIPIKGQLLAWDIPKNTSRENIAWLKTGLVFKRNKSP